MELHVADRTTSVISTLSDLSADIRTVYYEDENYNFRNVIELPGLLRPIFLFQTVLIKIGSHRTAT